MFRHRWLVGGAALVLGVACGIFLDLTIAGGVRGRFGEAPTPEQRSAMFASLERDIAAVEAQSRILKTVVRLVGPAVVHIEAEKQERFGPSTSRRRYVEEAGAGVIIEHGSGHYVLTNAHVIKGADDERIQIHLADGRVLNPTKVWHDASTDIAVMAISAADLVPARLGNSNNLDIGDFVLAVGSPFGLSHSVTYGIISAKGRRDLELGDESVRFQDFLQTDAAINPGNSGGPLLNLRGEVVGINTAIASNSGGNEGIGFSIPINMVMAVAKQLIERGAVTRAFLGVRLDRSFGPATAVRLGLPRPRGALITGIEASSPAEMAGLTAGDVVLEFNGISVEDDAHLINIVSLTEVDASVPVVLFRDRQHVSVEVKVGNRRNFDEQRQ